MFQYLTIGLLLSQCGERQPVQGTFPDAMLKQMAAISFRLQDDKGQHCTDE
jgi:hypothetical protein